MKNFTLADVFTHGDYHKIYAVATELEYTPLAWQKQGLQQTATGYGRKLTTRYKISFEGRLYRVYCTCFSNSGSNWIIAKGQKIFIS